MIGVRICDCKNPRRNHPVGAVAKRSRKWHDNNVMAYQWERGTCALSLEAVSGVNVYWGSHYLLLESDYWEWGVDAGEVILRDAVVVHWDKRRSRAVENSA